MERRRLKTGNPLIPDWSLYKGSLLELPGIQALLEDDTIKAIGTLPGVEGFTWVCCGLYEAKIGAGGPVAEEPVDPTLEPVAVLHPIVQPLPSVDTESTIDDAVFNFLAWRLYTPVKAPGGSCIEYDGSTYSLITWEPWRSSTPVTCIKPRPGRGGRIPLGPAGIEAGSSMEAGPLRVYELRDGYGVCGVRGCMFEASHVDVEIDSIDYTVHLLYPLHYRPVARIRLGRSIIVRALSMVLEAPRGSVAFSSSRGFTAVLEPGRALIEPEGTLRAARGGETVAYRILVEDAAVFRVQKAPGNLGHARPGTAAGVLVDAGRRVVFAVANPSYRDSMFEARIRMPIEEVLVDSLLGRVDIPASDGLARIPAPRGFAAMVEGVSRRRLRFKRMPQGGAEAASH